LLAELQPLLLMLQRQALRLRAAGLLADDAFRGLYIPDAQIDALLRSSAGRCLLPLGWHEDTTDIAQLGERIRQLRVENRARANASVLAGIDLPLIRLIERYSLSCAEVDLLLICVAPELDLGYETLYAYVQDDIARRRPTVDLVLALLGLTWEERMTARELLVPDNPLFRFHLVHFVDDPQDHEPSSLARVLRAGERVAGYLLGQDSVDRTLSAYISMSEPEGGSGEGELPFETRDQLIRVAHSLRPDEAIFVMSGSDESTCRLAARTLCAEWDRRLLICDLTLATETEQTDLAAEASLCREIVLQNAGIYLAGVEQLTSEDNRRKQRAGSFVGALERLGQPVFLDRLLERESSRPTVHIDIPPLDANVRRQLWHATLQGAGPELAVRQVADTFSLSSRQITRAARRARHYARLEGRDEVTSEEVRRAAREQSHSRLGRLTQHIRPTVGWDDIVLPVRAMQQLREVRASVVHRSAVYGDWGFGRKLALGRGTAVLFHGPSGTGKTMAAQVLAYELGLDLYRIDLAMVVSKYIGETEKNLSAIFREARTSNAILFFDEADALFGKRSEVKDAHDRYANIEVGYLLQQMEDYDGTVILATNLIRNLDDAFVRRLHHAVEFPFPDAAYRERIWQGIFPVEAPLATDVDLAFLAGHFELAGGNIRNVALAAAFMAAEEGSSIRMEHVIQSTARELQKMGKLPSRNDFGIHYAAIRERNS
jgi:ATP-dependent 26S proteasome regulatory subunit